MSLVDLAQVEIKLGEYGTAPATALADQRLLLRAQTYRRVGGARMRPMDKQDIAQLEKSTWYVSRKIDGEFTMLVVEGDQCLTVNPGGTVRVGLPFFAELRDCLKKAGIQKLIAAGELYVARPDGARARVHDVSRIARRPTTAAEVASLRFAVFDVIEVDGKEVPPVYSENWKTITSIFPASGLIHHVETAIQNTVPEIAATFEKWVEADGGEGLVVRSDSVGVFKVKPRHTLDVAVVGYAEGTEERRGLLHDLLIAMMRPDGTFHLLGRVGGGFTEEMRRNFLSDLKDMHVTSEYVEVNSDRVAYQMVRPEWVIEISCLDLITQNTRGVTVDNMVLQWDQEKSCYSPVRRFPLCSLISPQFIRLRDDKRVEPFDVRTQQLADLVEIPDLDRACADVALQPSEVLRRQVATKVLKGAQMVRKLVLWKTNKEQASAEYPAYVLYATDFSPNRKTPLERDIRVSSSKEQIEQLWQEFEAEYFGKGWTLL